MTNKTLNEIISNPETYIEGETIIYLSPQQTLKKKLNEELLNPDMKKLYKFYEKTHKVKYTPYGVEYELSKDLSVGSNRLITIFGHYYNGDIMYNTKFETYNRWYSNRYNKHGIEIKFMKPSKKTEDGKFKYDGVSIKDLKEACKINKIKGYSKVGSDKKALIKLLMTI